MLDDLICPLCKEQSLDKDNSSQFGHSYKGFSQLLGSRYVTCLNCKQDLASINTPLKEEVIQDFEKYVDNTLNQFYLYFETNLDKLFKHYKKGTVYKLIYVTNIASTDQDKFPTTAVYQDIKTKDIWSRPLIDFIKNFTIQG